MKLLKVYILESTIKVQFNNVQPKVTAQDHFFYVFFYNQATTLGGNKTEQFLLLDGGQREQPIFQRTVRKLLGWSLMWTQAVTAQSTSSWLTSQLIPFRVRTALLNVITNFSTTFPSISCHYNIVLTSWDESMQLVHFHNTHHDAIENENEKKKNISQEKGMSQTVFISHLLYAQQMLGVFSLYAKESKEPAHKFWMCCNRKSSRVRETKSYPLSLRLLCAYLHPK